MSGGELLETTARVLSIDERASPISDDDVAITRHQSPFAQNVQKSSNILPSHSVSTIPRKTLSYNDTPSPAARYEQQNIPQTRPPPPPYEAVRRRQNEFNSSSVLEAGDESDAEALRCVASKYIRYSQMKKHGSLQRQKSPHTAPFNQKQINAHCPPSLNASMI